MLGGIYESALKFLSPQKLPETYATAVKEAVKLTQADFGSIFLENHGYLNRVYTNVPKSTRTEPRKDGYTLKSFKSGKTFVMSTEILKNEHPNLLDNGIKSLVIIPLRHDKDSIGVLTLQAKKNKHFNKNRLDVLKVFGSLVSLAIQKNQLYNEAQIAVRVRDLFISMAAHELRTPTTTIQGYLQMMKKKYEKGEVPPRKWVEIVAAETLRLNNLLKELLQIDQIKTGQFNYAWKNNSIKEIIKRAVETTLVNHPTHKIFFQDNLDEKKKDILYSDFDKLLQSIINLINNAVKFSPPNKEITILLDYQDPYYKIQVKDQGKGIAKRDLPHIFEGFYKGQNNTKEGMGLGLYLAENVIQRHKGTIAVSSKLGKGTIVEIKLPEK